MEPIFRKYILWLCLTMLLGLVSRICIAKSLCNSNILYKHFTQKSGLGTYALFPDDITMLEMVGINSKVHENKVKIMNLIRVCNELLQSREIAEEKTIAANYQLLDDSPARCYRLKAMVK